MTEGFLVEGPDWNTVATPLGAGGDRPEDWRLLSAACGYTVDCVPRPAYATGAVKYALHWLKDCSCLFFFFFGNLFFSY